MHRANISTVAISRGGGSGLGVAVTSRVGVALTSFDIVRGHVSGSARNQAVKTVHSGLCTTVNHATCLLSSGYLSL